MPVSQCYVSLWLVIIETDGTYVSFWAEKPPNMLRLQFDSVLGFSFLVALADVEIIGCPGVEFRGGVEERFLPKHFERRWERPVLSSGKQNDVAVAGGEGVRSCWCFFCSAGSLVCCRLNTSCCSLLSVSSALRVRVSWRRCGGGARQCRVEGHPQHVRERCGGGSQWITYSAFFCRGALGTWLTSWFCAATGLLCWNCRYDTGRYWRRVALGRN